MIASLSGTIRALSNDSAVIDVNGVGYLLTIHQRTAAQLIVGSQLLLHTSMVVREDSMTLFAFIDDEERKVFELLQTVSGIGPKVALSITGALSPEQLMSAIAQEDIALIEKVPGIGRKGVQRLILELKGKVMSIEVPHRVVTQSNKRTQLLDALMGLGFSARESDSAISATYSHCAENGIDPETLEVSELLKSALQRRPS